jgi:DNA-binding response OmpR family regulator
MTRGTVLVVDDDDATHAAVTDALKEAGFGVVRVYDAVSALRVQAALLLDAVVAASDVRGMEALRERSPNVPIVFVTDRAFDVADLQGGQRSAVGRQLVAAQRARG